MAAQLQQVAAGAHRPARRRGSSSTTVRTRAPSRARAGCTVGTPSRSSGAAVTGPTQATSSEVRSACEQRVAPALLVRGGEQAGHRGRAGEGQAVDLAGDELLDQPAQRTDVLAAAPSGRPAPRGPPRRRRAARRRSRAAARRAAARRPGARPRPRRAGAAAPRRWTRVSGAQASDRPAARTAPLALGPRVSSSLPAKRGAQRLAEAPAVGGLHPAAEADAGRGDDHVGRRREARARGRQQLLVVAGGHDPDGGRLDDPGPPALQQAAELLAAPGGRHRHGAAGQRQLFHAVLLVRPPVLS